MSNNSPMELIHQIFVKLGARYIIVTDTEAFCAYFLLLWIFLYGVMALTDQGIIDKKTWLAFLSDLEEK